MKFPTSFSKPLIFEIVFFVLALVGIPFAIIQLQQQQETRSRANTALWLTNQSASSSCPTTGSGAVISVTFSNTEPNKPNFAMTVVATDQQSSKSVNMGSIIGGQTKSNQIQTGKTTLNAGSVTFKLTWTDGHSGTDSRTATYKAVTNCNPTPTPSPKPTATPTPKPSASPTPTKKLTPSPSICPTLGPVKNVRIDCPNCP